MTRYIQSPVGAATFLPILLLIFAGGASATPEVELAQAPLFPACGQNPNLALADNRTFNGSSVGGNAYVYRAGFDATTWSGSLQKLRLGADLEIMRTAEWDAGDILTGIDGRAPEPAPAARRIYTARKTGLNGLATIEFQWPSLDDAQRTSLDLSPAGARRDGRGEARVAYLRGERAMEAGHAGGVFRVRNSVLGDIVNSNPVYASGHTPFRSGAGYAAFSETQRTRAKAVYVGANDGMLHAFDGGSGRELFAYVPTPLIKELNQLTHPAYAHRPYVDGPIAVDDVQIGGDWRSVLVAGMGGGAQGVFALDVTDPGNFGGGRGVLWEFTDADDADMGNVYGAPLIAKFRVQAGGGRFQYKYFAAVSAGFNNYRHDGSGRYNASAPAVLFLLSLDKAASAAWQSGVNYFKFVMPAGDTARANAAGAPVLTMAADGAAEYAYLGDLQGNLWRIGLGGGAPWSRNSARVLFRAADSGGNPQPVIAAPKVVYAPDGGYVVLFGTGKMVEAADLSPAGFRLQSYYAVFDPLDAAVRTVARGQLAERTLRRSGDAFTAEGMPFAYGMSAGAKQGWRLDLPESERSGERSAASAVVAAGRLYFNTSMPGGTCGRGRTFELDPLTGLSDEGSAARRIDTGILAPPLLMRTEAPVVVSINSVGGRTVRQTRKIVEAGAGAPAGEPPSAAKEGIREVTSPAGRLSWRELPNWSELHRAAVSRR